MPAASTRRLPSSSASMVGTSKAMWLTQLGVFGSAWAGGELGRSKNAM